MAGDKNLFTTEYEHILNTDLVDILKYNYSYSLIKLMKAKEFFKTEKLDI